REMAGRCKAAEARRVAVDADGDAIAGFHHPSTQRSESRRPEDDRSDLYASLSVAWLGRSIMCGRAIRRWQDDGVVAYPRRLPGPAGDFRNAADAATGRPRHPCRRLRLLRP